MHQHAMTSIRTQRSIYIDAISSHIYMYMHVYTNDHEQDTVKTSAQMRIASQLTCQILGGLPGTPELACVI